MLSFFKGLISSPSCGDKVSHTKVWSNIGMAAMTAVFIYLGFWGVLPEWYLFTYASVVAAPYLIDKIITLRWGIKPPEDNEQTSYKDNYVEDISPTEEAPSHRERNNIKGETL